MGEVYKACDSRLNRCVAIKISRARFTPAEGGALTKNRSAACSPQTIPNSPTKATSG
jgi:hypothetical protein